MDISHWLQENIEHRVHKPLVLDLSHADDRGVLEKLYDEKRIHHIVDDYREQLKEHFQILHPDQVANTDFEEKFSEQVNALALGGDRPLWKHGRWIFYPWISTLVHVLEPKAFHRVRTARNRNLITEAEQEKFYNAVVGVAGLSVGNSVALSLALQGGARHMKLADHDTLALSNTNRIRSGIESLGLPKVVMTARQIYALNPYAEVDIFPDGLSDAVLHQFFDGLDVVVDEIDNLAMKYRIREYAKRHKIPVVMAADNGDNGVVDIERYDIEEPKFFHGRMGEVDYAALAKLDKFGIGKMITKHVGPENVTERMQQSLQELGKTLVSWPQLGGAALLNGSAVAYCVRRIVNHQPLESNRTIISLDAGLIPDYDAPEQRQNRMQSAVEFAKLFGL